MAAPGKDTTMKTLFLTTAAFAALMIAAPVGAHAAERYITAECAAPDAPLDKWTLRVDGFRHDVEFFRTNTPTAISWGPINVNQGSWTAVLDTTSVTTGLKEVVNLAGIPTGDHKTIGLTWVFGTTWGKMTCAWIYPSDVTPKSMPKS
jgi:hypothetical protein